MITKHFNTTFTLYRASSSVDENNFESESLQLYSTNKGYFEPLSGNERYISDKYEAYTTHRIFCPVINVEESDTLYVDSDKYNIDLIQNMRENHIELILINRK